MNIKIITAITLCAASLMFGCQKTMDAMKQDTRTITKSVGEASRALEENIRDQITPKE